MSNVDTHEEKKLLQQRPYTLKLAPKFGLSSKFKIKF